MSSCPEHDRDEGSNARERCDPGQRYSRDDRRGGQIGEQQPHRQQEDEGKCIEDPFHDEGRDGPGEPHLAERRDGECAYEFARPSGRTLFAMKPMATACQRGQKGTSVPVSARSRSFHRTARRNEGSSGEEDAEQHGKRLRRANLRDHLGEG
jgi:hypothetical protein